MTDLTMSQFATKEALLEAKLAEATERLREYTHQLRILKNALIHVANLPTKNQIKRRQVAQEALAACASKKHLSVSKPKTDISSSTHQSAQDYKVTVDSGVNCCICWGPLKDCVHGEKTTQVTPVERGRGDERTPCLAWRGNHLNGCVRFANTWNCMPGCTTSNASKEPK